MRSARLGTKYVTPLMKKQRSGSIINCASIAGMGVGYGPTLYSIGKAAVISLTKSVAIEWAGSGTPEDIAYAAVYLASDESPHTSGENLVVDTGITPRRSTKLQAERGALMQEAISGA